MRIVAFEADGRKRLGVVDGDTVVDLQAADPTVPVDLGDVLRADPDGIARLGEIATAAPADAHRPLDGLTFRLPVERPGKIVCLGLNYAAHADEGPYERPSYPTLFMRGTPSLVPHLQPILRPRVSEKLDYEAELVAVIGRRARHVPLDAAHGVVAAYACFNDGSVRDFQRHTVQWTMGKNFDRTGGFGPWAVDAASLPPGAAGLAIACRIDGATVQADDTASMMFPVAETIAYVTQAMTLEPGDLLVMGTPSGVGHARTPPLWLAPGNIVEIEIEGIGVLRNPVADDPAA